MNKNQDIASSLHTCMGSFMHTYTSLYSEIVSLSSETTDLNTSEEHRFQHAEFTQTAHLHEKQSDERLVIDGVDLVAHAQTHEFVASKETSVKSYSLREKRSRRVTQQM